jgi:ATP-dependent Clp protease adaptor protein ClpS
MLMSIWKQCLKKQAYVKIVSKKNKQMTGVTGSPETLTDEDVTLDLSFMEDSKLVLYNDDHNAFDKVIMALIIYCEISSARAAEFAMRIHNEGKAVVKYGSRDKLEPIAKVFGELDLTCEIEDP